MKTFEDPFSPNFEKNIEDTLKRWHCPGISFAVVQGDRSWTKCYGKAHDTAAVEPNTLFYAASTTKAMLAACWAIYIASEANLSKPLQERVCWDSPMISLIGEQDFVLNDHIITPLVTLEDTLSHRTGMARHDLCYCVPGTNTTREVTRALRHLPMKHALRSHFHYCNTMFTAATYALERTTGKRFGEYARKVLWEPLGMNDTYGGYGEAKRVVDEGRTLADGYVWSKVPGDPAEAEGKLLNEGIMKMIDGISGAGYAISTAEDYTKYMRGLLSASKPFTKSILNELWTPRISMDAQHAEAADDVTVFDGQLLTYALGWFVGAYRGYKVIWHPGALVGAGSMVMLVPDLNFGVSFFANITAACSRLYGLCFALIDDLLGVPEEDRYAQKRIEEELHTGYQKYLESWPKSKQKLYPDAPSDPVVPLGLPLEKYAGAYSHPGFGESLSFELSTSEEGKNILVCHTVRWKNRWEMEHVNAEWWLITIIISQSPIRSVARARSHIGSNGEVEGFDIATEVAMPDEMLTFTRDENHVRKITEKDGHE